MRIRLGDNVDFCVRAERDDNNVFFWLYSDELYIVKCERESEAQTLLAILFHNGYVDISDMFVMDKNWKRI